MSGSVRTPRLMEHEHGQHHPKCVQLPPQQPQGGGASSQDTEEPTEALRTGPELGF